MHLGLRHRQRSALFAGEDPRQREQMAHDTALLGGSPHAHEVGAFEGANYEARGFFRPQVDCIMFTRDEVPFCAVCRRAIERVLDLYAG